MPTTVIANQGDTLCGLAIAAGFLDCAPLRDANPGKPYLNRAFLNAGEEVTIPDLQTKDEPKATEQKHEFKLLAAPPVLIRFTHGSPDKPYRQDPDQTEFHISNMPTNKGGLKADKEFPKSTKFDQRGHEDVDAFKVEVVDPAGPAKVEVTLEAMKPVLLDRKPVVVAGVRQVEPFPEPHRAKRQQKVVCEAVPSKVCYRSPYLRMVVDDEDKAGGTGRPFDPQTILVAEISDGNGGENDAVEILDQVVRASYSRPNCPASTKCTVTADAPVGTDRKRVKLLIHILKDPVTGNPISNDRQVRLTCLKYIRQVYAQADLGIKFVGPTRDIIAPRNMITIDDDLGRAATGGREIKVRVRIAPSTDVVASITTTPGASCAQTASDLAAAIRAVLPAGITVRDLPNPPIIGRATGSADVLIGDPLVHDARVTVEKSDDPTQPVRANALTSTGFNTGDGTVRHVGNINSRLLLKNYGSTTGVIDIFVTGPLDGGSTLGLAFNPYRKYVANYGHGSANADVANSFLVDVDTLHKPGQAEMFYTTVPHEIGHVLMDAIHAKNRPIELMGPGSPVGVNERVVNGPKRISDGFKINFDLNTSDVPVAMFRDNNPDVFTSWDDI
ncbi:MAG: hypothetical protein KIT19_04940 [Phycisphaeraceae bacterium]|nr:hypothetical protein [Phycisphaeraceae bacterium]